MNILKQISFGAIILGSISLAKAGDPQRTGSSGGNELLINPWTRSSGWGGVNVAGVRGVEASFLNIAGISFTEKTDVKFSNTQWLVGADIAINAAGFNQKVGANGVLTANFVSLDYGDWTRTTVDQPEGGIGQVSPSTTIIGLGYAQKFTERIRGGVHIKLLNQSSVNLNMTTACVDAGVQYVREKASFGITLKNVGPSASFTGNGQSIVLPVPQGGYSQAYQEKSATFELPATLAIGGQYDFEFDQQRFTPSLAFQSNSFEKDQYKVGGEYAMKEFIAVRAGYTLFNNSEYEKITTAFTGFSAGISFEVPLSEEDKRNVLGVDYSYRATSTFSGAHSIGVSFSL